MDGFVDGATQAAGRNAGGRWVPGQSGNPAGKRKGTRNRATLLAEALRDGEGVAVARMIIDKALAGDGVAARFCVSLLTPRPRGRAITLDLPEGARPGDVVAAFDVTLAAMAAGEITPDEALTITKVLDGRLRALKAWQLEDRLSADGRVIPGDAVTTEDSGDEMPDDETMDGEVMDDCATDAAAAVARAPTEPASALPAGSCGETFGGETSAGKAPVGVPAPAIVRAVARRAGLHSACIAHLSGRRDARGSPAPRRARRHGALRPAFRLHLDVVRRRRRHRGGGSPDAGASSFVAAPFLGAAGGCTPLPPGGAMTIGADGQGNGPCGSLFARSPWSGLDNMGFASIYHPYRW